MKDKGLVEPIPRLWKYHHHDITTWRYIDCKLSGHERTLRVVEWVKNPEFKYEHLCRRKYES